MPGYWRTRSAQLAGAFFVATLLTLAPITAQSVLQRAPDVPGIAVLWREPTAIATRTLFDRPGGRAHAPHGTTFRFVKEDLDGSNPKSIGRDDAGMMWKLKLLWEAQPETAASRIGWGVAFAAPTRAAPIVLPNPARNRDVAIHLHFFNLHVSLDRCRQT